MLQGEKKVNAPAAKAKPMRNKSRGKMSDQLLQPSG